MSLLIKQEKKNLSSVGSPQEALRNACSVHKTQWIWTSHMHPDFSPGGTNHDTSYNRVLWAALGSSAKVLRIKPWSDCSEYAMWLADATSRMPIDKFMWEVWVRLLPNRQSRKISIYFPCSRQTNYWIVIISSHFLLKLLIIFIRVYFETVVL